MNTVHTSQLIGRIGGATVEFDGEQWSSDDSETANVLNQSLAGLLDPSANLKQVAEHCCAHAGCTLEIISIEF